jgi:hypothetical protein
MPNMYMKEYLKILNSVDTHSHRQYRRKVTNTCSKYFDICKAENTEIQYKLFYKVPLGGKRKT